MTADRIASVALLVARGCPDDALDDAFDWLSRRHVPPTATEMLAEVDEAIGVARAMHAAPDDD